MDDAYAFDQIEMISKDVSLCGLDACHLEYTYQNLRLFMDIPGALSFHDTLSWNL